MSPREVPRTEAVGTLPDTLLLCHLVAIASVGLPPRRAVETVWELARGVARSGRRVALVDLHLETPALHPPGHGRRKGIADAFLTDAPLTDVTRELEPPGLFFVEAGSAPADPIRVWAHPRWQRLARGFERENALLLLYLPTEALQHVGARPDRLVILAPDDYEADRTTALALAAGVDDGPEVIVIVDLDADAEAPPAPAVPARPPEAPWPQAVPRRRARRPGPALAVAGVGIASAAVLALLVLQSGSRPPPSALATSGAVAAIPPHAGDADSLYYAVQVAAFKSQDAAFARAADFEAGAWTATVAPVRLGRADVWYRLLVGALSTAAAAESVLTALWESGLVDRPSGTILRTPHALTVGTYGDTAAARRTRLGLRDRGVAAYIAEGADGSAQLLVGAFETPAQARPADSILEAAGLSAVLVPRAGITR